MQEEGSPPDGRLATSDDERDLRSEIRERAQELQAEHPDYDSIAVILAGGGESIEAAT